MLALVLVIAGIVTGGTGWFIAAAVLFGIEAVFTIIALLAAR